MFGNAMKKSREIIPNINPKALKKITFYYDV